MRRMQVMQISANLRALLFIDFLSNLVSDRRGSGNYSHHLEDFDALTALNNFSFGFDLFHNTAYHLAGSA